MPHIIPSQTIFAPSIFSIHAPELTFQIHFMWQENNSKIHTWTSIRKQSEMQVNVGSSQDQSLASCEQSKLKMKVFHPLSTAAVITCLFAVHIHTNLDSPLAFTDPICRLQWSCKLFVFTLQFLSLVPIYSEQHFPVCNRQFLHSPKINWPKFRDLDWWERPLFPMRLIQVWYEHMMYKIDKREGEVREGGGLERERHG